MLLRISSAELIENDIDSISEMMLGYSGSFTVSSCATRESVKTIKNTSHFFDSLFASQIKFFSAPPADNPGEIKKTFKTT